MSSILDALRKVEADERRRPIRLPPAEPRSRARLAAVVAAAAFVAGAGIVAVVVGLRRGTPPEPVAATSIEVASAPPVEVAPPSAAAPAAPSVTPPVPPPAESAPSPAAAAGAPPKAPLPAAPIAEAPDAGAPVAKAPADEATEGPVDDTDTDSDVPDQITILRPSHEPVPEAEVQVEALPAPAPAQPPIDVLPGPPAGAPEIHVSFLIYSAAPERRQVSLTIDNGPLLTLHEGQSAGGISLVRILRDRIHVEQGGRTFSVRAVL